MHLEQTKFPKKFEKLKFYPKITKTGVLKKMITIPLTLETMQQLIIRPWRKKIQKQQKIANNFKKA